MDGTFNYRRAGQCLMAGILLPLLILWLHPTAPDLLEESGSHLATVNHLVHGIALAAQPLLLLGLIALTWRLRWSLTATAALVIYCLGVVAIVMAALMSGFVASDVIAQLRIADPEAAGDLRGLLGYTHTLNQAFAKLSVVAAGAAIILWSVDIGRTRKLSREVSVAGLVIGAVLVFGILSGKLALNVQGMLVSTGLHALWLALVAIRLQRLPRP